MTKIIKKYLPYILLLISVFDQNILVFGFYIRNSELYTKLIFIFHFILIVLIQKYVFLHRRYLENNNRFLYIANIIYLVYFSYGMIKILFSNDRLEHTFSAIQCCSWFCFFGIIFLFQNTNLFFDYAKLWVHKIVIVLLFIYIPLVEPFHWEIGFVPAVFFLIFYDVWHLKERLILLLLILIPFFIEGQRTQIIRNILILMIILFSYTPFFKRKIINSINLICYVLPVVLLVLALIGKFNVFSDSSAIVGDDIQVSGENLSNDTRTFIYAEAIESSVKNNYVMFGRSPASGYDSFSFSIRYDSDKYYVQRISEVCVVNIYTWTGLLGLLILMFIYIYISFRCIKKSKNKYMKIIGLTISVSWIINWFANSIYSVGIYHLVIFMIMGFSLKNDFLSYNDNEFKKAFRIKFYGNRIKKIP